MPSSPWSGPPRPTTPNRSMPCASALRQRRPANSSFGYPDGGSELPKPCRSSLTTPTPPLWSQRRAPGTRAVNAASREEQDRTAAKVARFRIRKRSTVAKQHDLVSERLSDRRLQTTGVSRRSRGIQVRVPSCLARTSHEPLLRRPQLPTAKMSCHTSTSGGGSRGPSIKPCALVASRAFRPELISRTRGERAEGGSLGEIARGLNLDGVATSQGGRRWWPSTVRVVLARSSLPASS
jgi:hypothetical protein